MHRISRTVGAIVAVVLVAISLPIGSDAIVHAAGGTISGVVRNAQGNPIPSATVRAMRDEAGFVAPPVTVTADANGAFSLSGLAPAEYRIGASAAGYAARYANSDTWTQAAKFAVTTDATLTGDITLLPPTATISGRIIDDLGAPVVGASVSVGRAWPMGMYPFTTFDHFGRVVLTGADGTYIATGLAPGEFHMTVSPPSTSLTVGWYPTLKPPGSSFMVGVGASVTGIDLALLHTGTVTGRITSPTGAPVAGANVLIQGWDVPHQTLSAADGTYTITGVEPGPQIVFAQINGQPYMTSYYGHVLTGVDATSFTVPAGGTIGGIDIEMIEGVEVLMHVLDGNGQGPSYAHVTGCRSPDSPVPNLQAPSPQLDCPHSISAGQLVSVGPTNGDVIVLFAPGDYNVGAILADDAVTGTASVRVVLGGTPVCTLRVNGTSHCSPSPPPLVVPPPTPPPPTPPPATAPPALVCPMGRTETNTAAVLVTDIDASTSTASCPYVGAVRIVVEPNPT